MTPSTKSLDTLEKTSLKVVYQRAPKAKHCAALQKYARSAQVDKQSQSSTMGTITSLQLGM
eukprot:4665902-Amphidinium_carterae.1